MKKILSFFAAIVIYFLFFRFVVAQSQIRELTFEAYINFKKVIFTGWLNTILISTVSIILSLLVGLLLYAMEESKYKLINYLSKIHKTIIFGTPLLVLAIVSYYYIGDAFNIDSPFIVGCITLAFYIGAYIADIYKAAIDGIHTNQWQGAKMFGFSKLQTYRYIIFPQVIKSILPPLAGQFALTIKGSALLAYMSTNELLSSIQKVQAGSFRYTEGFIIVILGYWIITIPLITLVRKLEVKSNYRM